MFILQDSPYVIRKIHSLKKEIFLTFDDGPSAETTPQILDLLKVEGVPASFFVIGRNAEQNPLLIDRMIHEGHSVWSHSFDHRYFHYFLGKDHLRQWLLRSLEELAAQTKIPQKGFRPPAGVLTPPLRQVAEELNIPLILWNHRFFDTVHSWSNRQAHDDAKTLMAGDIVLLHDRQNQARLPGFMQTLRSYLRQVKEQGLIFSPLTQTLIESQVSHDRSSARKGH